MRKKSRGSIMGTYSYFAPEVYKGEKYDCRADIYSLGIVLYRLLNDNRQPFLPEYPISIRYSDREKANLKRMTGEILPPPRNADDILGKIVCKACSYNKDDRYKDGGELSDILKAYLAIRGTVIQDNLYIGLRNMVKSWETEEDEKTVSIFDIRSKEMSENIESNPTKLDNNSGNRTNNRFTIDTVHRDWSYSLMNWILFTCLLALIPLIIACLVLTFFGFEKVIIEDKIAIELLYFGMTLSVITVREMVSVDVEYLQGHKLLILSTLFAEILIMIFSSFFWSMMFLSDIKLLDIGMARQGIRYLAYVISATSFIIGTSFVLSKKGES